MPPHALKGPFLEHPQERCLDRQMQAAHFIEHERPTARAFKCPLLSGLCPGECPTLMAKEQALCQRLGNRRAIDCH